MEKLKENLSLFLIASLLSWTNSSVADAEWRQLREDEALAITVYERNLSEGFVEFKAVTQVDSTLSGLVALVRDVKNMPNWVDRTVRAEVLRWVSETEVYAYNVSHVEWPFKDRDAIVHTVLEQDPETLAVTISGKGVDSYDGPSLFDYREIEGRYIRMPVVVSHWKFTPLVNGRVEVEFQGYGDPGGNASSPPFSWIVDQVAWKSPYQTLKGLKREIRKNVYQNTQFDFIQEPGQR